MGWIGNLVESLTPAGRAAAEDRRARAMLEAHAAKLEGEVRQLSESVAMADVRLMGVWDQFQGLGQLLYPSGFPSDRKAGRDWPVLKDEQDLRQYRSFSRLLCETNSYAIGFRDHVRNYVVGTGFQWVVSLRGQSPGADSLDADPDPDVSACQQVLDEFRRLNCWGDDSEARADQSLADPVGVVVNREREGYERAVEDGEYFLRLFPGDESTRGVPTCREVEPECVTTPPSASIDGAWGWGVKSVEVEDRHGRRHVDGQRVEAYHLADPERPGELGEVVPAAHVVHLKLNAKASVKRGVPDFFPIEDELKGSKTLTRNMLHVSGLLAAIAYIREHAPSTTADQVRQMLPQTAQQVPIPANRPPLPGQAGPDQTRHLTVHQAGLVIDVSNQLKYTPGPVNSGVAGFLQAQQAALRAAGMRWGCPEYFSGDGSNANFASTLVAGGPFERATVVRQGEYKLFQGQLAVRVLLFAVESGRLTAGQVARVCVGVTVPPVAIADRGGDTQRRKTLSEAKVLDPITWCREEGYDPAQVAANWKAWDKLFPPPQQGGGGDPLGGGGGGGGAIPPSAPPGIAFGDGFSFGEAVLAEGRMHGLPVAGEARLTEALLTEAGFTGTVRDKRGVVRHYVDGRQVKGSQAQTDGGPHTTEPIRQGEAEQFAREALLGGKRLTAAEVGHLATALRHMTGERIRKLKADLKAAGHPVMSAKLKQDQIDAITAFARERKHLPNGLKELPPEPKPTIDYRQKNPDHPVAKAIREDAASRAVVERFLGTAATISGPSDDDYQRVRGRNTPAFVAAENAQRDLEFALSLKRRPTRAKLDEMRAAASNALEASDKARAALDEIRAARAAAADGHRRALAEAIGIPASDRAQLERLRSSDQYRPDPDPSPELEQKFVEAADFVSSITAGATVKIHWGQDPSPKRLMGGYYRSSSRQASVGKYGSTETAVHEMGHALEHQKPSVHEAGKQFLSYRTAGLPLERVADDDGHGEPIMAVKDDFDRAMADKLTGYYVGRVYGDRDQPDGIEVISCGLEYMYRDPVQFARNDPEYFQFMVSVLRKR
jgi:hypothetical protein